MKEFFDVEEWKNRSIATWARYMEMLLPGLAMVKCKREKESALELLEFKGEEMSLRTRECLELKERCTESWIWSEDKKNLLKFYVAIHLNKHGEKWIHRDTRTLEKHLSCCSSFVESTNTFKPVQLLFNALQTLRSEICCLTFFLSCELSCGASSLLSWNVYTPLTTSLEFTSSASFADRLKLYNL